MKSLKKWQPQTWSAAIDRGRRRGSGKGQEEMPTRKGKGRWFPKTLDMLSPSTILPWWNLCKRVAWGCLLSIWLNSSTSFCFFAWNMLITACPWPGKVHRIWVWPEVISYPSWNSLLRSHGGALTGRLKSQMVVEGFCCFQKLGKWNGTDHLATWREHLNPTCLESGCCNK